MTFYAVLFTEEKRLFVITHLQILQGTQGRPGQKGNEGEQGMKGQEVCQIHDCKLAYT